MEVKEFILIFTSLISLIVIIFLISILFNFKVKQWGNERNYDIRIPNFQSDGTKILEKKRSNCFSFFFKKQNPIFDYLRKLILI